MPETTADTTVDTVAVVKKFGKAVTKELAYEAGVHVAAITILLGVSYAVHKVQQRRVKPIPVVVVEPQ
jgi:hypothetical protein